MATPPAAGTEHLAIARGLNLPVSTKHCLELSRELRYKTTSYAKKYLEEVMEIRRAVPFRRFTRNVGHKRGMASGRFPQKAAKEMLYLIKSVEANAQVKGLNTSNLKITKLIANRAATPMTGSRRPHGKKRTHLEVEVRERKMPAKESVPGSAKVKMPKKEVVTP